MIRRAIGPVDTTPACEAGDRSSTLLWPTLMTDMNALADSTELYVGYMVRKFGGHVSFPFGDNAEYDLVADIGGELHKVQVKSTSQRNGEPNSIRATLCRGDGNYGYDDIDAFVLYNKLDEEYYWLWDVECADTVARVCTSAKSDTHPPNRERATFAEDVLLEDRLEEMSNRNL